MHLLRSEPSVGVHFFFFADFVLLPEVLAGFSFGSGFFPVFFSGSGAIFLNER